jgi:hypothetical protein
MSSNRLIFLFLGIIFLVIVILTSKQIGTTIRGWVGKYLPIAQFQNLSPTPTPTPTSKITPSPTKTAYYPTMTPVASQFTGKKSTPASEIPSTGPDIVTWFLLGSGVGSGMLLRKIHPFTSSKKN